jgi:hypothetical protein
MATNHTRRLERDVAEYLHFWRETNTLQMFDQPLCLFEYACGLFPKDIDQWNEIA